MEPRPDATETSIAECAIYLHLASRRELIVGLQALVWARVMMQPRIVARDDGISWADRLDAVVTHWAAGPRRDGG